jgi:hypothetical protein
MTPYYVWPALAVGVLVAARRNVWWFCVAAVAAIFTTVTAQWSLGELAWWVIDVVGVSVVVVAAVGTAARGSGLVRQGGIASPSVVHQAHGGA